MTHVLNVVDCSRLTISLIARAWVVVAVPGVAISPTEANSVSRVEEVVASDDSAPSAVVYSPAAVSSAAVLSHFDLPSVLGLLFLVLEEVLLF